MRLALTSLTLANLRSHPWSVFGFDGRPVVFTGANGAGKTNILEAISLLSPGRGLRRAAIDELPKRGEAAGQGWRIGAELSRDGLLHEIETGAQAGQSRWVKLDGKSATQTALGRLSGMVWLTPQMDRLWIEAPEGRRRFLDRLVLAFHPSHAEASLGYEKALRERNRLLREGISNAAWHGALEAQMAEQGAKLTANRRDVIARLAERREEGGPFPAAELRLSCEASAEPAEFAAQLAEGRRADLGAGRSLTGPHRADLEAFWRAREMPAAQCSTGEQKALLISVLLAHAAELSAATGYAPFMLFDEVAAHLDQGRRAALWDALEALKAQAFLTGTEASLFSELGARGQHFLIADGPQGSLSREADLA